MSLLGQPLTRLGVELESLSRSILRDYLQQRGAYLDPSKTEDALSFLIGTVWELSYLYDPPGFGAVQGLKRRMRGLAGHAADEARPLQRIVVVEANVLAGNRAFELSLRSRLPGPDARACYTLAQLYPRYRRWLVSQKRLKEVPDYGLDFAAEVRGMRIECRPLDMSFSTYAYRIGLRRVTDWFRGWGGDARYGQDVKPESLEQRLERDRDDVGSDEPGIAELLKSIDTRKLRPRERQTLQHLGWSLADGARVGELHELHPEWSPKEIRERIAALTEALEREGIKPSISPKIMRERESASALAAFLAAPDSDSARTPHLSPSEPSIAEDELARDEPGIEALLAEINVSSLRPYDRATLTYLGAALADGAGIQELHDLHPSWSPREVRQRIEALAAALSKQGIRPAVCKRQPEAVAA